MSWGCDSHLSFEALRRRLLTGALQKAPCPTNYRIVIDLHCRQPNTTRQKIVIHLHGGSLGPRTCQCWVGGEIKSTIDCKAESTHTTGTESLSDRPRPKGFWLIDIFTPSSHLARIKSPDMASRAEMYQELCGSGSLLSSETLVPLP